MNASDNHDGMQILPSFYEGSNLREGFQVCTLTVKAEVLMHMHVKKTLWLNLQLYKEKNYRIQGTWAIPALGDSREETSRRTSLVFSI